MNLTKIKCSFCKQENERNLDNCFKCKQSLGIPTVNVFSDPYYREGIKRRYKKQKKVLKKNIVAIKAFEDTVKKESKAILAIDFHLLAKILHEASSYSSYSKSVDKGLRPKSRPQDDIKRRSVETAFYGNDSGKIVYAALSLNEKGLSSYGNVFVTLKTNLIKHRTTLIEKNSYELVKDIGWNPLIDDSIFPTSYVAIWKDRKKIAVIKSGDDVGSKSDDWASLVLFSEGDRATDRFIELHIYDALHYLTFEKVVFNDVSIKAKKDKIALKIIEEKLLDAKIELVQ